MQFGTNPFEVDIQVEIASWRALPLTAPLTDDGWAEVPIERHMGQSAQQHYLVWLRDASTTGIP